MMDAISIAIIVTVLTLASALIYLFKSDFERRKKSYLGNTHLQPISYQHAKKSKPQAKINGNNDAKQVPSDSNQVAAPATQQNETTFLKSNKLQANASNGNQILAKANKQNKASKKADIASKIVGNQQELDYDLMVDEQTDIDGTNPTFDELDSSILLSVFNPSKVKPIDQQQYKHSNGSKSPQTGISSKKMNKKARQSLSRSPASYSSEELFKIIAASNLSKDEVELAVETLLNKIELGESDWKQPKNDPMLRLKNQLKDTEVALTVEIQNHEQTRARLFELKSQLLGEKTSSNMAKDELTKLSKEFNVINIALDQVRCDLSKQQAIQKQLRDENSSLIAKLEQNSNQLQKVVNNTSLKETELTKLHNELDDKMSQLQRYELSGQKMSETIRELETKMRNMDLQMDQMRSQRQHDDYEACAKISDLESDKLQLEKVLKDRVIRLSELSETNNLLEKSVKELQLINTRQEDMLTRLRDERHINEESMKRTLCDMDKELKELQSKLSANPLPIDEKLRMEISQVEKERIDADQREQKLVSDLRELREGLSALLPNLETEDLKASPDNWVNHYLVAIRQLAQTVDELRCANNNHIGNIVELSPFKNSLQSNGGSSRNSSPTSNGRSSRTGSSPDKKKATEAKLLELNAYVAKLESNIQKLEEEKEVLSNTGVESQELETIKELTNQRNKFKAQIKFGLDSLRVEQEKVRLLQQELNEYRSKSPTINAT